VGQAIPSCTSKLYRRLTKRQIQLHLQSYQEQVSVRSTEVFKKASSTAKKRAELGDALTISLLTGTIGESASRDMQAFFAVVDKLRHGRR